MEYVILEKNEAVTLITVNRPEKLNALNRQVIFELNTAFASAEDDPETRVIILTGAGEKAFVAGADIAEFASFSPEEGRRLAADGQERLFNFIENLAKPVIAAVNGYALGGGLELALACHIRLGATTAQVGLPEVSLGVIPGYGGTQRLARIAGPGAAFELITSAQRIPADRALALRIFNHIYPPEQLLSEARALAGRIAANSPSAISAAMNAIRAGYEPLRSGFDKEIEAFGLCFATEDFREGTQAFLEKRKPRFTGR
ncbi:MAG: enoyl-CoA hydratase-related protein [Flavobacteriales bacterium]|nr:enoyl-CoA hydratase-related protein [Flavobacteriales bacterium]MCX7649354.1 enoyl-CoA hydratase-related protein [Flavobacteriales bacterium]MDW8432773.1 enoyl-CoA hydratase-related protein [Flavobacteriales bacterium]